MIRLGIFGLALAMSALAGNAATLDNVTGEVFVNTGTGFVQVSGPVTLKTGDTIMASAGGSAVLTCDSGAVVSIQPGQVATVCDVAPEPAEITQAPQSPVTIPNELIIGGLVAGASAAAIIGFSDSSDNPVSGQ